MTDGFLLPISFIFLGLVLSLGAGALAMERAWYVALALLLLSVFCFGNAYIIGMGWQITVSPPF